MNILVAGGAGYIGSATAAHFIAAGHHVIVYDNLVRGHRAAVPPEAEFIRGDIGDRGALEVLFQTRHIDAVAHFAAFIEAGESMQLPGKYFHNNMVNSYVLFDTMLAHGVQQLVFSSTAAVYASKNAALNENDPLGPSNVYGETKLQIEKMIHWYASQCGLRYAILRYFNACGAMIDHNGHAIRGEAHSPETHLIPLILKVPLGQRESIKIFGDDYPTADGSCVRDYIHIEDLASAHVLALEALRDRPAMTYNLGNGQGYSVKQVVEIARLVTGHTIPADVVERRPGDAAILVASAEQVNEDIGWQPQYRDLRTIIESAWTWHNAYPNGYPGE